jgi:hypothetical protein
MRNLIAVIMLPLLAPSIRAQSANDVITGRVTDLTGRPVADAQVGATSLRTGVTRAQTTDQEGRYRIYFPETAPKYTLLVKRIGFSPVQRTITRHTEAPERMTIDLQFGGTPVALSVVEVAGSAGGSGPRRAETKPADGGVPNPVADILALKDTLHLSAVQIVALSDLSDSLQTRNTRIYQNIQTLLAKAQEAGDASQMAGSVAMMLEEASGNTAHAVSAAEKILRVEQWVIVPPGIKERSGTAGATGVK